MVPLFNSSIGYIDETIKNLDNFSICDYETLPINLHLSGTGLLKDLKYIHSKREILNQCKGRLYELDKETVVEDSSVTAAKSVRDYRNRAAITSRKASEIYGLKILEENIQDKKDNQTKFIILEIKI